MAHLRIALYMVAILVPANCLAQSHSPYLGFEKRTIKALSDQQTSDLRAGLGMSLALAAELNGYPGPRHTLELASELNLTDEQRTKAGDHTIGESEAWRTLARPVEDHELLLDEHGFGDDGPQAAWPGKPNDGRQHMQ